MLLGHLYSLVVLQELCELFFETDSTTVSLAAIHERGLLLLLVLALLCRRIRRTSVEGDTCGCGMIFRRCFGSPAARSATLVVHKESVLVSGDITTDVAMVHW